MSDLKTAVTASPVTRLHAVVRGRVQGVGFRYWTHHTAHGLKAITGGSVHNLPDGTIEVEAESLEKPSLEALLAELHTGPSAAEVEGVEASWEENVPPRYHGAFQVA